MILEVAVINIQQGQNEAFEAAYQKAKTVLASAAGYLGHEIHRGIETPTRYVLLVHWATPEDHTVGFRGGDLFRQWRSYISPFFDGPPIVEHYTALAPSET